NLKNSCHMIHIKKPLSLIHTLLPLFAFVPWIGLSPKTMAYLQDYRQVKATVSENCKEEKPKQIFDVTIVRSAKARSIGLSNRKTPLKQNEGMLFIFEPPEKPVFWMKNT